MAMNMGKVKLHVCRNLSDPVAWCDATHTHKHMYREAARCFETKSKIARNGWRKTGIAAVTHCIVWEWETILSGFDAWATFCFSLSYPSTATQSFHIFFPWARYFSYMQEFFEHPFQPASTFVSCMTKHVTILCSSSFRVRFRVHRNAAKTQWLQK